MFKYMRNKYKYFKMYKIIESSNFFDKKFYLFEYSDVRLNDIEPLEHYIRYGEKEGRKPNKSFEPTWYKNYYKDILEKKVSPFLHYIQYGKQEGRFRNKEELEIKQFKSQSSNFLEPKLLSNRLEKVEIIYDKNNNDLSKKNILLVAHACSNKIFGAERSYIDMLEALNSLSYNIIVVLPKNYSNKYINNIKHISNKIISLNYNWWSVKNKFDLETVKEFEELIKIFKIDLVYVNTIMIKYPLIAAKNMKVKSLVHVRELITKDKYLSEFIGLTAKEIIEELKNNTDYIFSNSEAIFEIFGNDKNNNFLVPNVVDEKLFDLDYSNSNILKIALISSNIEKKGIFDFIKIAKEFDESYKIKFLLIGPENNNTDNFKKLQTLGEIPNNVDILGYFETPKEAISKTDIVLNLSHFQESFGRTILEAMAAEKGVIAYNWGALSELIDDGVNGYLVEFKDYMAVVEKIKFLYNNRTVLEKISKSARKKAYYKYSKESYIQNMKNSLDKIFHPNKIEISVIIPNYNYEKYLPERINSILEQTYKVNEIIFLDDNSTDNSLIVAEKLLSNQNIPYKIISNKENQGVYKQWSKGFKEAKSDYIWIAEADDIADNYFLEELTNNLTNDVVLSYCQSKKIDGDSNLIVKNNLGHTDEIDNKKWCNDYIELGLREVVDYLVYRNTIPNASAAIFKKELFFKYESELYNYKYCGDWFLYISFLSEGKIKFNSKSLNSFRRHQQSVTKVNGRGVEYLEELSKIKNMIFKKFPIHKQQIKRINFFIDKDYKIDNIEKNSLSNHYNIDLDLINSNKRIAFVTTNNGSFNGGSEVLWMETALSLRKLGHDVIVLIKKWEPKPEFFDDFEKNGIKIYFKGDDEFKPIKKFNPDLLIISTGDQDEGIEYFKKCDEYNLPYVIINQLTKEERYWPIRKEKLKDVILGYKNAKKVFFTCENNHQVMENRLNRQIKNYDIHFNPFHMDRNISLKYPEVKNNVINLAVPARLLMIHKGQDLILEVFKKDKWKKRDFFINFYGDGPDRRFIENYIKDNQIKNMQIYSRIDNINEIWEKNHGILLASKMEGLPIVLVGAMICARTAILTDVGGHKEVVDDNINGFIANNPTVDDLDEALERAYSQRHKFEEMGVLSRERILEFLPENPVDNFINKILKI